MLHFTFGVFEFAYGNFLIGGFYALVDGWELIMTANDSDFA